MQFNKRPEHDVVLKDLRSGMKMSEIARRRRVPYYYVYSLKRLLKPKPFDGSTEGYVGWTDSKDVLALKLNDASVRKLPSLYTDRDVRIAVKVLGRMLDKRKRVIYMTPEEYRVLDVVPQALNDFLHLKETTWP